MWYAAAGAVLLGLTALAADQTGDAMQQTGNAGLKLAAAAIAAGGAYYLIRRA